MRSLFSFFRGFDLILFASVIALTLVGLVTMYTYTGDNAFFERQLIWICAAFAFFILASFPDYRFLRTGNTAFLLYIGSIILLLLVFLFGEVTLGAQSRFDFGFFSLQPADPAKIALIVVLAKYFSRRHVAIAHFKHIFVSGLYTLIPFVLIFLQPDFGSALIIFSLWLGMVFVAGISLRHVALVAVAGVVVLSSLWLFAFQEYQKERVLTFLNPLADVEGAGYNAYQSMIAVGSGQLWGKGIGHGTQSKLQFLPEYETDFIFAAFAEEWGFVGVLVLFSLFGVVLWRILVAARHGQTNFERLFAVGVGVLITSHFVIHVGINIGLLPVTGLTLPFLSYGGSHLVTEFLAVAMVMAMRKGSTQYNALVSRSI